MVNSAREHTEDADPVKEDGYGVNALVVDAIAMEMRRMEMTNSTDVTFIRLQIPPVRRIYTGFEGCFPEADWEHVSFEAAAGNKLQVQLRKNCSD